MAAKQEENKKGIELILSVLLAVSASYALVLFLDFDDISWLFFSIVSIAVAIFVIYSLMGIKLNSWSDFFMLLSFSSGMFLPFSLGKAHHFKTMLEVGAEKTTGLWWNMNYLYAHIGLLGIFIIIWGIFTQKEKNKEKAKGLYWGGAILLVLSVLSFVIKYGHVFK